MVVRKYQERKAANCEKLRKMELEEKQKRAKKGQPALALAIAGDYASLGEKDRAFAWLEKSFQEREGGLMYLNVDDRFAALRSDLRFQNLVHLIGLG